MQRRKFSREFKIEAVTRGPRYVQPYYGSDGYVVRPYGYYGGSGYDRGYGYYRGGPSMGFPFGSRSW